MNILILGGDGYLGSKLSLSFCEKGNYCYRTTVNESIVGQCSDKFCFISADSARIVGLIKEKKMDCLINTVAVYEKTGTPKSSVIAANAIFPLSVIPVAIENGVKKIITIDTSLPDDFNFYSLAKSFVAKIGQMYCRQNGSLLFANIILENFYGPDEPKNRFLQSCVALLKENRPLELTKGDQRRDFVSVFDVIGALGTVASTERTGFYRVPVGSGESPSIREVVEYLKEITKSQSELHFGAIPQRANEPSTKADLSVLESFGYHTKYSWKNGMKKCFVDNFGGGLLNSFFKSSKLADSISSNVFENNLVHLQAYLFSARELSGANL